VRCGMQINGEYPEGNGLAYHKKCFHCSKCKTNLFGQQFVSGDPPEIYCTNSSCSSHGIGATSTPVILNSTTASASKPQLQPIPSTEIQSKTVSNANAKSACVSCGAALDLNSKFCIECGEAQPVQSQVSQKPTPRFCTECGESLSSGSKFCIACGNQVN